MKITLHSLLGATIVLLFSLFLTNCKEDETKPQPAITSFTPVSGYAGTQVTIMGNNFNEDASSNTVKFNGINAIVTSATATQIVTSLPAGAVTGKVSVTVDGMTGTSATDFTVLVPLAITSFTPSTGVAGTTVTITGTSFSTVMADNVVKFNSIQATVTAATSTALTVTVPAQASTGKINIIVNGNEVASSLDFTIPVPTITSFAPAHALPGETLIITGTNFSNGSLTLNKVKVNNANAIVTAATGTQLTVTVPATTTGTITVDVGGQTTTSVDNFEVLIDIPRNGLVAFYPFSGNANDVSGNNLSGTPTNGPTLNADRYQNLNRSYLLDGTNDYIDMGDPAQLRITDKITISVWVNLSAFSFQTVLSKYGYNLTYGANRPANGYDIRADIYSGLQNKTYFGFRSFIESSVNFASFVVGSTELLTDNWYQATLVIDHGTWTFYKNGVQTNQVSAGAVSLLGDGPGAKLIIGGATNNVGVISAFFHGAVDDIAIYDRALSGAEVTQLYQQTVTKY